MARVIFCVDFFDAICVRMLLREGIDRQALGASGGRLGVGRELLAERREGRLHRRERASQALPLLPFSLSSVHTAGWRASMNAYSSRS